MGDEGPTDDHIAKGMAQVAVEEPSAPQSVTEDTKEIDELPEQTGTWSNPMSRRQTFGEVSDYFVRDCLVCSTTSLTRHRLDQEILRNTQNGQCLCNCMEVSYQKWFFH
jgi:hypothetical protein